MKMFSQFTNPSYTQYTYNIFFINIFPVHVRRCRPENLYKKKIHIKISNNELSCAFAVTVCFPFIVYTRFTVSSLSGKLFLEQK